MGGNFNPNIITQPTDDSMSSTSASSYSASSTSAYCTDYETQYTVVDSNVEHESIGFSTTAEEQYHSGKKCLYTLTPNSLTLILL